MGILSGIATAPGVSALLNAPRDTNADLRATVGEQSRQVSLRDGAGAPRVTGARATERPVLSASATQQPEAAARRPTPENARFARFVKAVQALRLDRDTASALTPDRVEQLRAAAKEVFKVDDVPRDVRPSETRPEPNPGPSAVEVEARRAEQAEKAAARAEEAQRRAEVAEDANSRAAAERAEARAARQPDDVAKDAPAPARGTDNRAVPAVPAEPAKPATPAPKAAAIPDAPAPAAPAEPAKPAVPAATTEAAVADAEPAAVEAPAEAATPAPAPTTTEETSAAG